MGSFLWTGIHFYIKFYVILCFVGLASHRISSGSNVDRTYHPTKEDTTYLDDDEIDEDDDDEEDDHRRHHQQSTYRGRGRPSQQHLMDSSYDDRNWTS
jgi:hypothetical protein